jgi:hypothetical protein
MVAVLLPLAGVFAKGKKDGVLERIPTFCISSY